MSWGTLFERAREYDATVAGIRESLAARRDDE